MAMLLELPGGQITSSAIKKATGAVCPKVYNFVDQHLTSYFGLPTPTDTTTRPIDLDQLKRDPLLLDPNASSQAIENLCLGPAPPSVDKTLICGPTH